MKDRLVDSVSSGRRLEITDTVRPKGNQLEIEVANQLAQQNYRRRVTRACECKR